MRRHNDADFRPSRPVILARYDSGFFFAAWGHPRSDPFASRFRKRRVQPSRILVRTCDRRDFAPPRINPCRHRPHHHSSYWRTTMKLRAGSFAVALAALALANSSAFSQSRSLYDRLGGYNAITAVVDDFVANVAADRRINRFFAKANIGRLKARLVEQICQGTGGPCIYTGGDMRSVHAGMGIQNKHFNALVQDLGKSLNKFKVPAREQRELVAIL